MSTTSTQEATITPALATRKVPGSISRWSPRPERSWKPSISRRTCAPTSARSTDGSSGMRPTLKPPPRLMLATSGSWAARSRVIRAQRFHTSGSVPEPTCEWSRRMRRSYRLAIAWTSPSASCQIPKLEAGPPVLVRLVEPVPSPGFTRTESSPPGREPPELLELVQRAGVEEHAAREVPLERARRHLRRELDALGREARPQRPLDLEVARGVDVQAELAEQREDAAARVGLHRVAHGEAERRREGQRLPRRRLERGAIVDVAGRAEALAHQGGDIGGDASGGAVGSGAFHPLESTASRLPLEVLPALVLESGNSSSDIAVSNGGTQPCARHSRDRSSPS